MRSPFSVLGYAGQRPAIWSSLLPLLLAALMPAATALASPQEQQEDPAAIELYNTGARLYSEKQYELAIAQWNKLLADFPEYNGRRDAQYYTGLAHYNLKQFDKAAEFFAALRDSLSNLTDYSRSDKMLIYLAFSQYQQGRAAGGADGVNQVRAALDTYQQFFDNFADSTMSDNALYFQGDAFYELNRMDPGADTLDDAIACYRTLVDEYSESPLRAQARFVLAECLAESGDYAQACQLFTDFIADYPDDPSTDGARLKNADCLLQLALAQKNAGNASEAEQSFRQAAELYATLIDKSEFEDIAPAKYQRALCLLHLNDYGSAADLYASIATDHPEFEHAAESALDAGKYYFTADRLDDAETWLTKAIAANNQFAPEATHWLCRIKLAANQFDQAHQLATDALAGDPGRFRVNLMMDAADALYGQPDRRAESIAEYEKVVDSFPDDPVAPKALYYAAFGYLVTDQNGEAIKAAERFRDTWPDNELYPDTVQILGQAALKKNDLELAESTFKDLSARFPDHPRFEWWQTRIGWASYLSGNHDDAIAWLSQAAVDMQDPAHRSEARYVIGSSQFQLKNYVKAIEALEASLTDNPQRVNADEVRLLTARAWYHRDDLDQARQLAQQVLDSGKPEMASEAAYWLGEFAWQSNDYDTAISCYKTVVSDEQSPRVPDALYALAWAQGRSDQAAASLASFDALIERFPEHELAARALLGRGMTRRMTGDFAGGIEDLNRYLETQPGGKDQFNATYERALCYVGVEDWEQAAAELERIKADSDQNPDLADDILYELAWARKSLQDESAALADFQQLVQDHQQSPHFAEANYHVAQDLYRQGQYDQAIEKYETCLQGETDADVAERAAYKLAWCYFKKEDFDAARQAFEQQTTRFPQGQLRPIGLSMVAESHFRMDQHEQAVTAFKVAIPEIESADIKDNGRILWPIHAAQSANKIKDHQTARNYALSVINDFPESEFIADAWYELGAAEKGLGEQAAAISAWEQAMIKSLGKTGARARCMIAEEHFANSNYQEAINQFMLVLYGYGGKESVAEVRPWQAFAAYEAARCYYVQIANETDAERRKDLIENSRKFFQTLVDDYPDDRLAEDAKKQIQVLDSLN